MDENVINFDDYDTLMICGVPADKPDEIVYKCRYNNVKNQFVIVLEVLDGVLGIAEDTHDKVPHANWDDEFTAKSYEAILECYKKLCEYDEKYNRGIKYA